MTEIEALIARATARNNDIAEKHRAFSEIVRRFQDMACSYAYAIMGDFQLAQDAAQEAFITAYRELGKLQKPSAFASWLKRLVLTQCNRLKRKRPVITESIETIFDIPSGAENPAEAVVTWEMRDQLFAAIGRLPEKQRHVTRLFYMDAYSQKEIAESLNVPVTSVNNWLHASRKRLKVRIRAESNITATLILAGGLMLLIVGIVVSGVKLSRR